MLPKQNYADLAEKIPVESGYSENPFKKERKMSRVEFDPKLNYESDANQG